MFYCKYCRKNKEDEEISVYYKHSIKCINCVKQGRQLTHIPRTNCKCGVSYFNINRTTLQTHNNSKKHIYYLNSLVK